MRSNLWIPIAFLVLATPRLAAAIPDFPAKLQEYGKMPCAPQCTVCHRDNNGGIGTLIAFGEAIGGTDSIDIDDPDSLKPALEELAASSEDTDGDGIIDVAELADGQNPNIKGDSSLCGPTYGCGATIAKSERTDWLAATVALFVSAGLVASWRRRHERRAKRASR